MPLAKRSLAFARNLPRQICSSDCSALDGVIITHAVIVTWTRAAELAT